MDTPPERLGSFYLGAIYDLEAHARRDIPLNYDARDLTTHAVCVGMTGSGKTGLCLGLLEEAALDKVPAILIDPKGDITNLLLQFPELRPADFEPWVNPDDARRKGQTIPGYAATVAEMWREGLADWGIDGARIRALGEAAQFTIFTPGSDAGVPVNILGSLAAPALDFDAHAELLRERIAGTVAALLGLAGSNADPVRSREAILLANIFEEFWRRGEDLTLAGLITAIQTPPVRKLGVFDVDTFFPAQDRFELAMAFNSLMAAPSFQAWLQGTPLDVEALFFTAGGKPRHSIFYIAHLSDSERMFFVTLLLESLLTWMRRQSGTTSLRALLYFDEVFGFFPPTAEPPSKRPLLTLLKQARAFGLGCILVTQNPVDIDYKGLTNAGTWFIGKLQAERDKARVLEGLQGAIAAAGGQQAADYDALITRLQSRVFLLHNVHEPEPVVFHTRWVMSYLRGPLTRPQIRQLQEREPAEGSPDLTSTVEVVASPPVEGPVAVIPSGFSSDQPSLDPTVAQVFVPITVGEQEAVRRLAQASGRTLAVKDVQLLYEPALVGGAIVRYVDRKRDLEEEEDVLLLAPAPGAISGAVWERAAAVDVQLSDLSPTAATPPNGGPALFAPTPEAANSARELKAAEKELSDWLYYNKALRLTVHPDLELFHEPGETERSFKARLQQAARERRDAEIDKLEEKYERELDRLRDRLRRERRELADDEADYAARKQEEVIGIGETVVGFFLGRRSTRSVSRAATKRRLTTKAKLDIEESQEEITSLEKEVKDVERELADEVEAITTAWSSVADDLTVEEIKPRRTDVNVRLVALGWLPSWRIIHNAGADTVNAYSIAGD